MSTTKQRDATIEKERKVYNFLLECTMRDGGYIGTYREVSEALDCVGSEGDAHHHIAALIRKRIVYKLSTSTGTRQRNHSWWRYAVVKPWRAGAHSGNTLGAFEQMPPCNDGLEFYRGHEDLVLKLAKWVRDEATKPGAMGEVRMYNDDVMRAVGIKGKGTFTAAKYAAVSRGLIMIRGNGLRKGASIDLVPQSQEPLPPQDVLDAYLLRHKDEMPTWREPVPVSKALRSGPKGAPRQDTVPVSTSSTPVVREPVTTIKATQAPLPLESGEPSDDMALAIYYAAIKAKAMVGAKAKGGWWLLDGQAGRDLGSFGSGVDLPKHTQQECFLALHRKGYVEAGFDRARQAWQYMIK